MTDEPEVVIVPLPHGLAAHYVMRPKPTPRPAIDTSSVDAALGSLTPAERAALGLPDRTPVQPWDQPALDDVPPGLEENPCPF